METVVKYNKGRRKGWNIRQTKDGKYHVYKGNGCQAEPAFRVLKINNGTVTCPIDDFVTGLNICAYCPDLVMLNGKELHCKNNTILSSDDCEK